MALQNMRKGRDIKNRALRLSSFSKTAGLKRLLYPYVLGNSELKQHAKWKIYHGPTENDAPVYGDVADATLADPSTATGFSSVGNLPLSTRSLLGSSASGIRKPQNVASSVSKRC